MPLMHPSQSLVLTLTFQADHIFRETEPDWEKSLSDDVKAECESKFGGRVERIVVEKESKVNPIESEDANADF
jgi:hypothetical protein